jgi:TonB family protein
LLIVVLGDWAGSQNVDNSFGFSLDSDLEILQAGQRISAVEARRLESRLASNPEDIKARALLGAYYYRNAMRSQRLENALWLIEHHPDSELLRSSAFIISAEESPVNDMASYERAKARWLALSHDEQQRPEVLWNASSFISQFDPPRAEQLALAGKNLGPNNHRWNEKLAFLYAKAVFTEGRMRPQMPASAERNAFAEKARHVLDTSSDAELVGIAGNSLAPVDPQIRASRSPEDIDFGLKLLQRARRLAPNDVRWDAYLRAFSAASKDSRQPSAAPGHPGNTSLSKNAEPGTLLLRVEPGYSSEALRAGLQGTVRVEILIGTDGHVLNAWLIDGHPLLYLSAYQAVRQWVYEPLRVANDPVEAYHRLEIQFRLPTTPRIQ